MRHPVRRRSSADTVGDVQRVLGKLESSGRDLAIVRAAANWDSGLRPFVLMADALLIRGRLRPDVREACVLHIAAVLALDYEWDEHLPMARRAGLTHEQLAALRRGDREDESLFDLDQRRALDVVDEYLRRHEVCSATWDAGCEQLGEDEMAELMFAIAWWAGFVPVIARTLVALSDRPNDPRVDYPS